MGLLVPLLITTLYLEKNVIHGALRTSFTQPLNLVQDSSEAASKDNVGANDPSLYHGAVKVSTDRAIVNDNNYADKDDSYWGDDLNLLLLVTPLPKKSRRKTTSKPVDNPDISQDSISFPTTQLPQTLQTLLKSEPNDYDFIPTDFEFIGTDFSDDQFTFYEDFDPSDDIQSSDNHLTPPFEENVPLEERKNFLHKLTEKSHKSRRVLPKGFHLPKLMNDPLLNLLLYGTAFGATVQGLGLVPFDIIHFDIKEIRRKKRYSKRNKYWLCLLM